MKRWVMMLAVCGLAAQVGTVVAAGDPVPAAPELPVLLSPTPRGGGLETWPLAPVAPVAKHVDGEVSDWVGESSRFAGTATYSAGEYVYQDYLQDDTGADDGQDAERDQATDPLAAAEPRTSRLEALSQAAGDQFGLADYGIPKAIAADAKYGDAAYPSGLAGNADIEEARVAADAQHLYFLVRTTAMTTADGTAVLLLLDTAPGGSYQAPGGVTTRAEWAFLLAGDRVVQSTYKGAPSPCGAACPVEVASNPSGFTNAVEVSIGRALLGDLPQQLQVGVATGILDTDGKALAHVAPDGAAGDLLNVAMRPAEPLRIWMDHDQALALRAGDIDRFLAPVDLDRLTSGYTEGSAPRPGYYERVYVSHSPVVQERISGGATQGEFQFYGLYLPSAYGHAARLPATFWLHFNGGRANDLAAWIPGAVDHLGERRDGIVISPSARGTGTPFMGRGLEDFLEVSKDAMASFPIDDDRVDISGYSLGGFGTHLLGRLFPDRFAAAFSIVGTPYAGAPGFFATPGEPRLSLADIAQNARNLPYVMYHGTNDEIVPVTDEVDQSQRLSALGYRYRLHLFPGYEHYTFAIVDDQWSDAVGYLDGFRRDRDPDRVTYRRWPALETLVNTTDTPVPLHHAFDGAYWVSDMTLRGGDPADPSTGAEIDARSLARGEEQITPTPDVGAGGALPGQQTAYVMIGQKWVASGRSPAQNRFLATLTNLATVTLDLERMAILTTAAITAHVTTDGPAELRLRGSWQTTPTVSGATVVSSDAHSMTLALGSGEHELTIVPG